MVHDVATSKLTTPQALHRHDGAPNAQVITSNEVSANTALDGHCGTLRGGEGLACLPPKPKALQYGCGCLPHLKVQARGRLPRMPLLLQLGTEEALHAARGALFFRHLEETCAKHRHENRCRLFVCTELRSVKRVVRCKCVRRNAAHRRERLAQQREVARHAALVHRRARGVLLQAARVEDKWSLGNGRSHAAIIVRLLVVREDILVAHSPNANDGVALCGPVRDGEAQQRAGWAIDGASVEQCGRVVRDNTAEHETVGTSLLEVGQRRLRKSEEKAVPVEPLKGRLQRLVRRALVLRHCGIAGVCGQAREEVARLALLCLLSAAAIFCKAIADCRCLCTVLLSDPRLEDGECIVANLCWLNEAS